MVSIPHYYGDTVRKLFLVIGLTMLITLPFLKSHISSMVFYSILVVIIITFLAGLTNPKQKNIIWADIIFSIVGFIVFAYQTNSSFNGTISLFFLTNLTLAILFMFAIYWGLKTWRWLHDPEKVEIEEAAKKKEDEKYDDIINPSENAVVHHHKKELTEEERRRKRFLGEE